MLRDPTRQPLPRFAGQRVRTAEVAVEVMNRQPIQLLRSSFSILTFEKNGTLVPPLSDRHVRARAELALALDRFSREAAVAVADAALGLWLAAVSGRRRRRRFDDGLSRRPWEDCSVPGYRLFTYL